MFELKDHKLVLDPNVLSLPWFKEIWNMDKSKEKEVAIHQLTYIFYLVDYKSPYFRYPEVQRRENILRDIIKDPKFKESKEMKEAIEKYKEFLKTPSRGLLESAKNTVHKIEKYLNDVDLNKTKTDAQGNELPYYDLTAIQKSIAQLGPILDSIHDLEEKVKKENSNAGNRRGGEATSMFED